MINWFLLLALIIATQYGFYRIEKAVEEVKLALLDRADELYKANLKNMKVMNDKIDRLEGEIIKGKK